MANYWDDFKPSLLSGEDYWEDFTPEAPTETGVVGAVTGNRYQPWEKGYHNIAGLVDDSGDYDAWYDPDPPPETSRPEWGTPEGYENWKTRMGLETGTTTGNGQTTGSGTYIGPEGSEGEGRTQDEIDARQARMASGDNTTDFSSLFSSKNVANSLLAGSTLGPAGFAIGLFKDEITAGLKSGIQTIQDILSGTDTGTEGGGQTEAEISAEVANVQSDAEKEDW